MLEKSRTAQTIDALHLDELPVDRANPMAGVDADREEDPNGDERNLHDFIDAKPEDDERQQGQLRNVADREPQGATDSEAS